MKNLRIVVVALAVALFGTAAEAKKKSAGTQDPMAACTADVKSAVAKAFPDSTIDRCKAENDHGKNLVEVKLTRKDGSKVEVDVGTDGKILQTEEKIAIDKVPAAVMKAFSTKYPKAKATGAEKQSAEKSTSYEIAFTVDGGGKKEATFAEDGKFIEEE
ncbi:MAG: putative beta-lactamase-inhibitor-like, PepSY-like [Myxococcales bacterium]|nr:putative beta-lactamase-inhibitor-like, PepSY-like [Myxococcales bacterium]